MLELMGEEAPVSGINAGSNVNHSYQNVNPLCLVGNALKFR